MVKNSQLIVVLFFLAILGSNALTAEEDIKTEKNKFQTGHLYEPKKNVQSLIDQTIERANESNKRVILAIGANWCHDSRSFASRLYSPELKPIIEKNYELFFVDVGFLDQNLSVIEQFGSPAIYATPTVLVIDPETKKLLNSHDRHQWRDAHKIKVDAMFDYFKGYANRTSSQVKGANRPMHLDSSHQARLNQLTAQIDEFEAKQAERIYAGFKVIGPLIKRKSEEKKVENFVKYWKSFSKFRYKLTDDLLALHQQAQKIALDDSQETELEFPSYPPFAWET